MLFSLFQLGADRYAIDVHRIVEILPLVEIKQIPLAPAGIVGAFNYRGEPVPAVDLGLLVLGRPAKPLLSTRILVVRHVGETGCEEHLLGLIAEQVTGTLRREASDFVSSGVTVEGAPYLGPVTRDGTGLIQRVEVHELLPPAVRSVLFRSGIAA